MPGDVSVRPMRPEDLDEVAAVTFAAFLTVELRHGYDPAFPSVRAARNLCGAYLRYPEARPFVAEVNGRVAGAAFLHPRGATAGVGPVAVDPSAQNAGVGRALMERLIREAGPGASVRLVQAAFNRASFSLYTRLGFQVRDALATMVSHGPAQAPEPRTPVTVVGDAQVAPLARFDEAATGIRRATDLSFLTHVGTTFVAGDASDPDGYLCRLSAGDTHYLGPAVARDEGTLEALLAAALRDLPGGRAVARVPSRHHRLLTTAMEWGMRVGTIGTYMVRGPWREPEAARLLPTFPESL